MALCMLGVTLWGRGHPDQALTRSREAHALARELSHPYRRESAGRGAGAGEVPPRILERRFAAGEIDQQEFEERRRALVSTRRALD